MSYARFGADGSEVYVFTSHAGIECCGCWLQEREWREDLAAPFGGFLHNIGETVPHVFDSNEGMVEHLERHRAAGHIVPEYVFDRLRDPTDAAKNAAIWAERSQEVTR